MNSGIICVGNNIFETLLAITAQEQERGLMYVDPPIPNMTFVYERPQINKFWMANTKAPLDIIFCNAGKVSQICAGEPFSTTIIGDNKFSDLVVELPYGTAIKNNIKIGHSIKLIKPNKDELKEIIAKKLYQIVKL